MTFVRNLTLTSYGKQGAILKFLAIWRTRVVILNFVIIFNFVATTILNLRQYGGHARYLNLNLTCYFDKATIFKYGGLVR